MPGLGSRLGRGGATTYQQDLANSDCIVIMGANMAENHPVGFRFVLKAKTRGATVIHVDPRFSRTSALADLHVPIRAGSDLVFLGALVNYAIQHEKYFRDYVVSYTNAATIVSEAFQDTEDLDGLFSGYDPGRHAYRDDTWQYAGGPIPPAPLPTREGGVQAYTASLLLEETERESQSAEVREGTGTPPSLVGKGAGGLGQRSEPGPAHGGRSPSHPQTDPTLEHPRCVFQLVKRHYSRYTPEMVEEACGVPRALFLKVAEAITGNSGRERTTAFCYAVAWTQHTIGTQIISCCALLQLLLGNIGRPGGGILALRGHATIQGSTDIPTLYNLLPGYLPMPSTLAAPQGLAGHDSLRAYLERETSRSGWWHNTPKYLVSLLKAWYGDAATPENDYAFDYLPKITADYSFQPMLLAMKDSTLRGLFCMGQNPAVGGQNARLAREGLANLDWLVVRDIFETETASFWYRAPEVESGEVDPRRIGTEVFLLPAAITAEKDGSYTNTQRLVQFHDKAVEPPGEARSEAWFVYHLGRRLRELYADSALPRDRPLQALTWDYPTHGPHAEPDADALLREINGYRVADGQLVQGFTDLRDDGSTACGCWIYSGILPAEGVNLARARRGDERAALGWGFAWPANRRMLYNRASADPDGRPWSERKRYLWWDAAQGRWTGYDTPDFPLTKPPDYTPPDGAVGIDAHSGRDPFIMITDGKGQLFVPRALKDGPLPTHYEPFESPLANPLYAQQTNPVAIAHARPDNPYHAVNDPRFPYVLTTYRLTEHHTAGAMTRWLPWLAELQPQGFVEISPELAAEHGVQNGDWVVVSTLRGETEARALVTERLRPLTVGGRRLHQVGMPWHFGYMGLATGGVANDLSALVEDPDSLIHEAKAFTCNLRKGRLPPHPPQGWGGQGGR